MDFALVQYPHYKSISPEMRARVTHLPEENLRELRQAHLNLLIKVCGVVTRRTAVFPQLSLVKYNCAKVRNPSLYSKTKNFLLITIFSVKLYSVLSNKP
jgi:DNA replicative helicase MCM subunit Mcm2 (Cdc46/Mcm family)